MSQGAANEVHIAPSPIATAATAPESSLSLAAWAVPCPCEIVPSANPRETGWVMSRRSISHGPKLAPIMPVITTKIAVSVGLPWTIRAISTAIGSGRRLDRDRGEKFRRKSQDPRGQPRHDHRAERSSEQTEARGHELAEKRPAVLVQRNGKGDGGGAEEERHDLFCRPIIFKRDARHQQNGDDDDRTEQDRGCQRRRIASAGGEAQSIGADRHGDREHRHNDCGRDGHIPSPMRGDLRRSTCDTHPAKRMPTAALTARIEEDCKAARREQISGIH